MHKASTLKSAKERYRVDSPDIVFLDLGLPDGDGLDLLRASNHAQAVNPLVVIVTGRQAWIARWKR